MCISAYKIGGVCGINNIKNGMKVHGLHINNVLQLKKCENVLKTILIFYTSIKDLK